MNHSASSPQLGSPWQSPALMSSYSLCMIEAYDLRTLEQLAQFRTVSPVAQVAYNSRGDCVVALERKHSVSQGFVRVYFKWRGLSTDKPMRILMASIQRSIPGQNRTSHINQINSLSLISLPSPPLLLPSLSLTQNCYTISFTFSMIWS